MLRNTDCSTQQQNGSKSVTIFRPNSLSQQIPHKALNFPGSSWQRDRCWVCFRQWISSSFSWQNQASWNMLVLAVEKFCRNLFFAQASAHNKKCGYALFLSLTHYRSSLSLFVSSLSLFFYSLFFTESFYFQLLMFSLSLSLFLSHTLLPAHIVASFIYNTHNTALSWWTERGEGGWDWSGRKVLAALLLTFSTITEEEREKRER